MEKVGTETAVQEAHVRPPLADKEKGKVEEVSKKNYHFFATRVGGSIVGNFYCCCKGAQKRATEAEVPDKVHRRRWRPLGLHQPMLTLA